MTPSNLFVPALLTSVLALGGCAVGPRFVTPQAGMPAGWSATSPNTTTTVPVESSAGWWRSFGDPELADLIDRAMGANFSVRQAALSIGEARAQRRMAAAGAWPQVDATASYENSRISERTATSSLLAAAGGGHGGGVAAAIPGLTNPFEQYQYGLSATWELDLFGRVRRGVEAADADTDAAIWDGRAVRVSLMAEVAAAYLDLRASEARRGVAAAAVETSQALLKLARDSRGHGLTNDVDLAAAAGAAASAEAELPPLDRQISADKNQLALLLALQPGALDAELDKAAIPLGAPAPVPLSLPANLARRRPDVRRAEAQLHAAVARQGVATAALYPAISLNTGFGYQASNTAQLGAWAAHYLTAGPSLDLPIFDAGQRRANVKLMDLRARSAALTYAQTVLTALHEVNDAITAYASAQSQEARLAEAAGDQRAALAMARRSFAAGAISFRDVLLAQDKQEQADLARSQASAQTAQAVVSLYRALGGGWREE